jgi:hypothetical protein
VPLRRVVTLVVVCRLWDYAHVSSRTLEGAKKQAADILGRAGVGVEWLDCRLRESDPPKDPACALPITPRDLQMRILDRSMAKQVPSTRDCLGYALLAGGFDSFAAVFFQRAIDLETPLTRVSARCAKRAHP